MDYFKKLFGYGVVNESSKLITQQNKYDTFDKEVETKLKDSMFLKSKDCDAREIEKLNSYKEPLVVKIQRKTNMHDN